MSRGTSFVRGVAVFGVCLPLLGCAAMFRGPAVNISIDSAVIAASKPNGNAWDCCTGVPPGAAAGLLTAVGASNPMVAVGAFITNRLLGAFVPPDAAGTAQWVGVDATGQTVAELPKQQDNYQPGWCSTGGCPTISGVRLARKSAVLVTLTDADEFDDDAIGAVALGYPVLRGALKGGVPLFVDTHERADGSVLGVVVAVTKAPPARRVAPPD